MTAEEGRTPRLWSPKSAQAGSCPSPPSQAGKERRAPRPLPFADKARDLPELETRYSGSGVPVTVFKYSQGEEGEDTACGGSQSRPKRVAPFPPPGAASRAREMVARRARGSSAQREEIRAREEASIALMEAEVATRTRRCEVRESKLQEMLREHGQWCAHALLQREREEAAAAAAVESSALATEPGPGLTRAQLRSALDAVGSVRSPPAPPRPPYEARPLVSPRSVDGGLPRGLSPQQPARPPTAEEVRRRRSRERRRDEAEIDALCARLESRDGLGGLWADPVEHQKRLQLRLVSGRRPSFGRWQDPRGRGLSDQTRSECGLERLPSPVCPQVSVPTSRGSSRGSQLASLKLLSCEETPVLMMLYKMATGYLPGDALTQVRLSRLRPIAVVCLAAAAAAARRRPGGPSLDLLISTAAQSSASASQRYPHLWAIKAQCSPDNAARRGSSSSAPTPENAALKALGLYIHGESPLYDGLRTLISVAGCSLPPPPPPVVFVGTHLDMTLYSLPDTHTPAELPLLTVLAGILKRGGQPPDSPSAPPPPPVPPHPRPASTRHRPHLALLHQLLLEAPLDRPHCRALLAATNAQRYVRSALPLLARVDSTSRPYLNLLLPSAAASPAAAPPAAPPAKEVQKRPPRAPGRQRPPPRPPPAGVVGLPAVEQPRTADGGSPTSPMSPDEASVPIAVCSDSVWLVSAGAGIEMLRRVSVASNEHLAALEASQQQPQHQPQHQPQDQMRGQTPPQPPPQQQADRPPTAPSEPRSPIQWPDGGSALAVEAMATSLARTRFREMGSFRWVSAGLVPQHLQGLSIPERIGVEVHTPEAKSFRDLEVGLQPGLLAVWMRKTRQTLAEVALPWRVDAESARARFRPSTQRLVLKAPVAVERYPRRASMSAAAQPVVTWNSYRQDQYRRVSQLLRVAASGEGRKGFTALDRLQRAAAQRCGGVFALFAVGQ
eukprot:TRINITY_DN1689_c0_g2_i1.p1 TRINITY_DN1689_c0_g2~~TRINITY_DN1689_c0_g2_i1.p1  ORF type:complete len:989 (+),score=208.47 TRINITY_DN1689_c0_g2_i1:104-2968(+)